MRQFAKSHEHTEKGTRIIGCFNYARKATCIDHCVVKNDPKYTQSGPSWCLEKFYWEKAKIAMETSL